MYLNEYLQLDGLILEGCHKCLKYIKNDTLKRGGRYGLLKISKWEIFYTLKFIFLDNLILYYSICILKLFEEQLGISVVNITTKFGESAGMIWIALNEKGPLKKEEIQEITNLNKDDLHGGLGWLAREDKIFKENNNSYKLENTNLESEIGSKAGRLWRIMDIWGEVDFDTIKRLSDLDEDQIHLALGWLAREDKISTDEKQRYSLK